MNSNEPSQESNTLPSIEPLQEAKRLPTDSSENVQRGIVAHSRTELFSGPIPHPDILKGYNELVPDAAERILKAFEKQSEHRECIEKETNKANINLAWANTVERYVGLIFGFIIACIILYLIYILAINGNDTVAGILASATIAAVVGLFLKKNNEADNKKDDNQPQE